MHNTANLLKLGVNMEDWDFVVALAGNPNTGKSTVFNNLLDGHLASRITARGHATKGPILAVHEDRVRPDAPAVAVHVAELGKLPRHEHRVAVGKLLLPSGDVVEYPL